MPAARSLVGLNARDKVLLECFALGLTEGQTSVIMNKGYGAIHTRATRIREYSETHTQAQMVYWALDTYQISPLPIHRPIRMTARQTEIVELIARGYEDEGIAGKLFLGVTSVRQHVVNAMNNTGALNRNNLVGLASSGGLIV